VLVAFTLAACSTVQVTDKAPDPIGNFKLGFAVAVAQNVQKGPLSRTATPLELETAMKAELGRVLGAYDGDKLYDIAVAIDAYVLALPGIPIVASPKSALVVSVTVWDDAARAKITKEPKRITVIEDISAKSIFCSGLRKSKDEQIRDLTRSAVRDIVKWMSENQQMFESSPPQATPATAPPASAPSASTPRRPDAKAG